MAGEFELAQINIGRLKAPIDALYTKGFVDSLEPINAMTEAQPGFVWRLTGGGDNATGIQAFDDPMMLLNMSVWDDTDSLAAFVYRTDHRGVMRRRRKWFHETKVFTALWWIPAGHRPTPAEGRARLETLQERGPAAEAFTFRQRFPAPGDSLEVIPILDECA